MKTLVPERSTDEELLLRYFRHHTGEELFSHPSVAQETFEAIKDALADGGGLTRQAFNTYKHNEELTRLAAKHRNQAASTLDRGLQTK